MRDAAGPGRAVPRRGRRLDGALPRPAGQPAGRIPLALAVLVGTTLVLLFLMTGSVVLPIKAVLMNALT